MMDRAVPSLLKWRQPWILLFLHFSVSALGGILILASILPAISVVKVNLSVEKKLFLTLIVFLVILFFVLAFAFLLNRTLAIKVGDFVFDDEKQNLILLASGMALMLCWVGFFLPPYQLWQGFSTYLTSIKPLFAWGVLHFASIIAIFRLRVDHVRSEGWFTTNRLSAGIIFTIFFLFTLVSLFVIKTGYGISTQEDYWYGPGVPVLWTQILLSVLVGFVFSWLRRNVEFGRTKYMDSVMFLMIWLVAAYLWGTEPLQSSYFMPDTGINAIYPYSDSATFDAGAQYALIGQGLFNGQYFDRTLYSALLAYLHALAGQETGTVMVFQAVLFAVFPAILYLVGRELHGRVLGISLAFLIVFRGINSIFGASLIDLAGPKIMLTDFPTAIGISLILLFLLKWLRRPQKISNMIWAGCVIGLTLLLRTHVIFLLPFVLLYIVIHFRDKKTLWVYGSIFLILGMIVTTLPVDFQNQKKGVPMFYLYYSRIEMILKARYGIFESPGSGVLDRRETAVVSPRGRQNIRKNAFNIGCDSQLCSIGNHFFHNLAGSILYLPPDFVLDDFSHVVKESAPYWQKDWAGADVGLNNYLLLFLNLALISVGVGFIWKRIGLAAFLPLIIYIGYLLSNALALTSGGRYLAPVDWIIAAYYVMGVLQVSTWSLRSINLNTRLDDEDMELKTISDNKPVISFQSGIGTLVMVFFLGGLLPLTDVIFPQRYQQKTANEMLATLTQQDVLEKAGLDVNDVEGFLMDPNARLTWGRLLYPRFYASSKGEPGLEYPYTKLDYRRLVFTVIGPASPRMEGVILPQENAVRGLNGQDVVVLGCTNGKFLDALVVFVLAEPGKILIRPSGLTLQCPLPNP
jgi:hypothetical protein